MPDSWKWVYLRQSRWGLATILLISTLVITGLVAPGTAQATGSAPDFGTPSVVAPDSSGGGAFNDVSCPNSTSCVAVGENNGSPAQAIYSIGTQSVGVWSWTTTATILPDASNGGDLSEVSCPTSTLCVAVGEDDASPAQAIYSVGTKSANAWTWTVSTTVTPDSSGGGAFNDVSCPNATSCVAVGVDSAANTQSIYSYGTWSGGGWTWTTSAVITPDTNQGGDLYSVNCADPSACVAVGEDANAVPIFTSGALLDGTWSWTGETQVPGDLGLLWNVDCLSTTSCIAVGWDNSATSQAIYTAGSESGGQTQSLRLRTTRVVQSSTPYAARLFPPASQSGKTRMERPSSQ